MVNSIKSKAKAFISHGQTPKAIAFLLEELNENSALTDLLIIQSERNFRTQDQVERNIISIENAALAYSQIANALLDLIKRIGAEDLKQGSRPEKARQIFHPYHRFTCNRINQFI